MIKARHNRLYIWFFRNFFGLVHRFCFRKVTVIFEVSIPEDQSVLMFQNHISWWDGYWSYLLCWKTLRRKFHVMMLEDELLKRLFLNRCGVFSIRRNSRDFLNSLWYSSELLHDPKNLVTVYPTGALLSQHQQAIHFLKGIDRIVRDETGRFVIVLAVSLVDYFSAVRPEVRFYLKVYSGERTVEAIESAYCSFYQDCVSKQTE